MRREIRYVELKTGFNDDGPASISWVTFSKSGRTVYYHDRALQRIIRGGIGSNHRDTETGEEYWISGVKKDGEDRHWAGKGPVIVDEDAREEYERITSRTVRTENLRLGARGQPERLRNEAAFPTSAVRRHSMPAVARTNDIVSTAVVIVRPTPPFGTS